MDIKLNFSHRTDYLVDEARISSIIKGDEKGAVQMNVWEKIKDFFRTDKKADAYQELYNLLHNSEGSDKLDVFNKLKSFATPECQKYFTKEIYYGDVCFFVGKENVGHSSLQELMNISEHTRLHSMSVSEQSLFLKMLDTLREKTSLYSDSYAGYIRGKMSDEHCFEVLDLYRPQEGVDDPGTELVNTHFLDYKEERTLRHLGHGGGTVLQKQFSAIGYQKTDSGVSFNMLHPSISYLLDSYSKSNYDGSSSTDINSEQMTVLNRIYHDYMHNKSEIDKVLTKVYDTHNGTLNISFSGRNNNRMVMSPCIEQQYLFQSPNSLGDISNSLDAIFNKWTGAEKA